MTPHLQRETLRHAALEMGFDACGFARAVPVQQWAVEQYDQWIADGCNDCMEYATKYREVRNDPRLLIEGAKTVISVAINYLPAIRQPENAPQFALYAYGRDYHEVVKERLIRLATYIEHATGWNRIYRTQQYAYNSRPWFFLLPRRTCHYA